MATYEDIYGKRVKFFDSDPTLNSSYEGQVWYDSTSGQLKSVVSFAAWSSQTSLGTNKYGSGFGQTVDASGIAGIQLPPGGTTTATEEFNGIGWTTGGSFSNAAYRRAAAGTQTSAFLAGGYAAPSIRTYTENYDGTSWTGGGTIPQPSQFGSAQGPQTAGFYGGAGPDNVEWYDYGGSSYSNAANATSDLKQRALVGNAAAQTAAVASGGNSPPGGSTNSEEWNGTAFSNTSATNIANWARGTGGTSTNAVVFGSAPNNPTPNSSQTATETWDGTSYTTSPATTSTARTAIQGGAGIGTSALFMGGSTGPAYDALVNSVEEYNLSINTVTAAAWAAGGTVPYTSRQNMSFGTQTAAISCGGYTSTTLNTSVSYNGTSYSSTPTLNVAARMGGVAGTQAAGLQFGGIQPPGTYNTNVQSWNGSAWSNNPYNLSTGTYGLMGCGTQTAALKVGGENPGGGNYTTSEEYDGEGWTAGGALPESKYVAAGNGVQTSAIITGGSPSGTTTFEYNGSSWTAGGALATSRPGTQAGSAGATSDSNIVFGGGPALTVTEGYDGTAWSTRPSLATGRGSTNGNGIATAGLMVSGGPPSGTTTNTEEFTGTTETVTAKTLTTG